jgi:transcriptional regulator with PAS, ATPase and Fis domain
VSDHSTEKTPLGDRSRGARVEQYLFLVIEGCRLRAGGMRIALRDLDELAMGYSDARNVRRDGPRAVLGVPDPRMSGQHARMVRKDTTYHLEDRGSTNGTLLNGVRVRVRVGAPLLAHALKDGDIVELGQTLFLYREMEEDAADPPRDHDAAASTSVPSGLRTLDPTLARRFARLGRTAPSALTILLLGETGTGKELLARAIHVLSQREGPFVAINCGAIPANLVESHLFGHVRGAFSGAMRDEPGMVRAANMGTLLLDEIGDLPLVSQAALLRALQEGEVLAVGSTQATKVDVRVIAATHRPIEASVERGEFRRDLYARLAGYSFHLPPLRERKVDLGLLIAMLLTSGKFGDQGDVRMHPDAARAMLNHDWPMNIRELEQCLHAALVLAENGLITVDDLPEAVGTILPPGDDVDDGHDEELRRDLLVRIADAKGNVTNVARAMGKARQQVQRWLRRYGIDPDAYREK